jgi:hypothetical protein
LRKSFINTGHSFTVKEGKERLSWLSFFLPKQSGSTLVRQLSAYGQTRLDRINSIFLSQHDGDHPLSNGRISRVWGVKVEVLVVVVNFEKYLDTIKFNRAKVMLTVGIVSSAKIVERRDSLDQTLDGLLAQGGDAWRHDSAATQEVLA